jgi:hypothetical protein
VVVIGGLDRYNFAAKTALLFRRNPSSTDVLKSLQFAEAMPMAVPRFGHEATLVKSGLLKGSVLVTGGLTHDEAGKLSLAPGAEIFVPR